MADSREHARRIALARHVLALACERRGIELPVSWLAVEALDGGSREAPAIAWEALRQAPRDRVSQAVARAVARAVENGAQPAGHDGGASVHSAAALALGGLGHASEAAYEEALRVWREAVE